MANVNNIRVGSSVPETVAFDKFQAQPADFKFDFRNWVINEEAGHDIEVTNSKIIIKKFKPNVWIMHSEKVTGSQNHAICDYCQGTHMTGKNVAVHSGLLNNEQPFDNNHGAGNDKPKFKGFCIYPLSHDLHWMQERMYTWESCWDTADTRKSPDVADWNDFRLGNGGHGIYGITTDFKNKLMFPDELYDFNTWGRNPSNTVVWYYGFMLATGNVQNFDDGSWVVANDAVRNGKVITITKRLADGSTSYHVARWNTLKACKIKVTGLQSGDRLEHGYAGSGIASSANSITADGTYGVSAFGNGNNGAAFKLYGEVGTTSEVTIELVNDEYPDGIVDISDSPIVIEAEPDNGVDVTNIECWDAYLGSAKIWHKDKTVENCWIKHGLMFPNNYNLFETTFTKSSYLEWKSPIKFVINSIPAEGIDIYTSEKSYDINYLKISLIGFSIRIINKAAGVNITFKRPFANTTNTGDSVSISLAEGINEIPAYDKTVYRADSSKSIRFKEAELVISGAVENASTIIEFIPVYNENGTLKVYTPAWSNIVSKIKVPIVTDVENYIARTKFNMAPANAEVWDRIKTWYENNTGANVNFGRGNVFKGSRNLKEITIRFSDAFCSGEDNFFDSDIETINFVQENERAHFTAPQRLLRVANKLKNINIIWANPSNPNYVCAANTIVDGLSCSLETYPERFVNWAANRSNVLQNTIECTLFQYAFYGAHNLVTIPSYPGSEDENTIIPANNLESSFAGCYKLTTIGPVLDLIVCRPGNAKDVFAGCNVLSSVKIKHLSHGSWNFDGVIRDGVSHGNLAELNADSVQYLFVNLVDLTTHDAKKHENTIDKSFINWGSDYFNAAATTVDWDYNLTAVTQFSCKKRYADASSAVFVVSTNSALTNMRIRIEGLKSGDSIIFGADGSSEPLYTFTTNGVYTISKDATMMGFKFIGSNVDDRDIATITIENGLDYRNPSVSSANLYCPKEWVDAVGFDYRVMTTTYDNVVVSSSSISFSTRQKTSDPNATAYCASTSKITLDIEIKGLIAGDVLGIGNGSYSAIQNKITENGNYTVSFESGVTWGFKLWNDADTSNTSVVTVTNRGESKITDEMVTAANTKGWSIYVGGTLKTY